MQPVTKEELIWAAGLVDGDGCFEFTGANCRPNQIRTRLEVSITHLHTARRLKEIFSTVSSKYVGLHEVNRKDREAKGHKRAWKVQVGSKEALFEVAKSLSCFLFTKYLECSLTILYLNKAIQYKRYTPTDQDYYISDLGCRLKDLKLKDIEEAKKFLQQNGMKVHSDLHGDMERQDRNDLPLPLKRRPRKSNKI